MIGLHEVSTDIRFVPLNTFDGEYQQELQCLLISSVYINYINCINLRDSTARPRTKSEPTLD